MLFSVVSPTPTRLAEASWCHLRRPHAPPSRCRPPVCPWRLASLFEPLGLRSLILNARLGFSNLEHATIRLRVVTTDVERAEVVVLSRSQL